MTRWPRAGGAKSGVDASDSTFLKLLWRAL
jgi:hypothetical protein